MQFIPTSDPEFDHMMKQIGEGGPFQDVAESEAEESADGFCGVIAEVPLSVEAIRALACLRRSDIPLSESIEIAVEEHRWLRALLWNLSAVCAEIANERSDRIFNEAILGGEVAEARHHDDSDRVTSAEVGE